MNSIDLDLKAIDLDRSEVEGLLARALRCDNCGRGASCLTDLLQIADAKMVNQCPE